MQPVGRTVPGSARPLPAVAISGTKVCVGGIRDRLQQMRLSLGGRERLRR
jgi:hypothetical protein